MGKLTDYYRIHRHAQNDLEIQIVDRSQANLVRSMQSLSGGESFLVSLALGPSESAGREGSIDLIFIDEANYNFYNHTYIFNKSNKSKFK